MKFPVDAQKQRVLATLAKLGFVVVREGNHIALERRNTDGTATPMTIPNHAIDAANNLPSGGNRA